MSVLEDFRDRLSASVKYHLKRRPLCAFDVDIKTVISDGMILFEFLMKCRAGECTLVESFSEIEAKLWMDGKTPGLVSTICKRLLDNAQELILVPQ